MMHTDSAQRFDTLARRYATSEVHATSPTLARLRELLPAVQSVCDVASGAGHTGLAFAGRATRLVAVDPAPNMLAQVRELAAQKQLAVETVAGYAEQLPLSAETFDLVTCRLAAHHFSDVGRAVQEMTRVAKPGGHVAVIDLEGDDTAELDALNHDLEVLHDPTHVRSYTARRWRELFSAAGLEIIACDTRCREIPAGLTVGRWCEVGGSGDAALAAIRARLAATPSDWRQQLEITQDPDGEFRLPIRTLLIVGRKPVAG